MGALSSEQTPFILLAAQLCRDVALHAGLGANLLIQPIKNTLSSLDGKAGHTGGVRYPCSDSDVRPCSHNYTHNGPFYRSVLTLRIIKNKKIKPPTSNSLWVSSLLHHHQQGLSGLQHCAVLLGGEMQGLVWESMLLGCVCVCVSSAGCWCGVMAG